MTNQLAIEYQYFKDHLGEMLAEHLGEYVLIKGRNIEGFYPTYKDAISSGYKNFGNVPFFVKIVEKEEEVHFFHQGLT